jgi:predicted dehydrogenase/sugar phosphate isomerase/epimerase
MPQQHEAVLAGCGARGQAHARALTDSDRFDLRAVCDLDADRVAETAREFDVTARFTDLDEAIAETDPTHVSCVTPPTVRSGVVAPVLDSGVDSVLVEKPMANTFEEVRELETLATEAGARLTVCFETLWADEIRALKRWLDDGRLGDVRRLVGTTKGGLTAQGSHFLHMLDWLLEDTPEEVRAFAEGPAGLDPGTNPWCPGHAEPVDAVLEATYPSDERAFCHFGAHAPDEPAQAESFWLEYRLDVVGTDGHAQFVHGDHARATFADGSTEYVEARDFDEDAYMTRGLYDDLGAALAGKTDSHPADLDSAVAAHRSIDAAMRSAERSRAIPQGREPPVYGSDTTERLRRALLAAKPLTVSTLMYGERDRATTLDALADLGVESVDLWAMSAFADHVGDDAADEIADALDRRGLDVPVVSVFDDEPVEPKLETAAALDAEAVVMGGRTPDRSETWDPGQLREWLDRAAEHDLTLAFENHLDTLETVDEMGALLDALDHPAAGVCLAPTHLHLAGERVEEALTRLGDDVAVLYLWDMEPGATRADADDVWWDRADSQVPGGGGSVDFERVLDLAVEYTPDAPWVMCYHGTEGWGRERIQQSIARGLRYVDARRS